MSSSTSITIAEGETGKISIKAVCGEAKPDPKESNITLTADVSSCCVSGASVKYSVTSNKGFSKTGTLSPTDTSSSSTQFSVPVGATYTITGSVSGHTCKQGDGCQFSWSKFNPSKITIPLKNANSSYSSKAEFGCEGCSVKPVVENKTITVKLSMPHGSGDRTDCNFFLEVVEPTGKKYTNFESITISGGETSGSLSIEVPKGSKYSISNLQYHTYYNGSTSSDGNYASPYCGGSSSYNKTYSGTLNDDFTLNCAG